VLARTHETHFATPKMTNQMEVNDPFERVKEAIIHSSVDGIQ
jgi:hypothetical protein